MTKRDKKLIGPSSKVARWPSCSHALGFAHLTSLAMSDDDDQDIFDSLEREASEFTKVGAIEFPYSVVPAPVLRLN